MVLIISITAFVISLWIIISWLTGTWPRSLICTDNQAFFDGKCYDKMISCNVENGSWEKNREWNTYSACEVTFCSNSFELIDNACLPEIRMRKLILTWSFVAKSHILSSYPVIAIINPIQWWTIKMTIDFQKPYKDGRYDNFIYWGKADWSPAKPYNFWLFFFLGKWNQWRLSPYAFGYGWFFDALTLDSNGKPTNSSAIWANWVVPWNQIIWGYTREIPLKNNVIFATKTSEPVNERRSDYQFKRLNLLDYINNNIGSTIYLWWYLSNMNNEPGWKFTQIKSIEIDYIWISGAVQFLK